MNEQKIYQESVQKKYLKKLKELFISLRKLHKQVTTGMVPNKYGMPVKTAMPAFFYRVEPILIIQTATSKHGNIDTHTMELTSM